MTSSPARGTRGTCGACFAPFALDPDGYIGRHGWREAGGVRRVGEAGNVFHEGKCFGVGRAPYEVSVDCTVTFLAEVLRPTKTRLDHLLHSNASGDDRGVAISLARAELATVEAALKRCEAAVRTWAPAPLLARRGLRVHKAGDDPSFTACGRRVRAWANSIPLSTTTNPEEVTCPRPDCASEGSGSKVAR